LSSPIPPAAGATSRPFDVTHRSVLAIAVPMTFAFLTTPLLGLTDLAVVGQFGDAAMIGGLAVGAIVFDFVFAMFYFLRLSTTGLVAQALGRDDRYEEQAVFWRAMLIAAGGGLAILLLSPAIAAAGLWLMAPDGAVAEAARSYIALRILAAPFTLANYVLLGVLLGRGESLRGLLLQILINVTNIVFSILFGLWLGYGLEGVAIGTVIGEVIGAVAGTILIVRRFDPAGRPTMQAILDRAALARLVGLNRDIFIRTVALMTAFALFTRTGAQFGAVTLAANAILMNFFLIGSYFLDGLATAAEQIVGRAIGANFRPAFSRGVRLTVLWGFVMAAIFAFVTALGGGPLIDFMTTASDVREEARTYLVWAALSVLTGVLAFQMDGVFIGATWSREMRDMGLVGFVFFLALLWLVVPSTGNTGLWIAFNAFLVARGILLLAILGRKADATFAT
jgi:MATE family multidrug resistance protein